MSTNIYIYIYISRGSNWGGVRWGEVEASTPEADKRLKESEIIEI